MLHSTVAAMVVGCAGIHPVATAAEVDHHSTQHAVQLAAVPSPFEVYPRVFRDASRNAADLLAEYFEDPFPILRVTASSQAAALADSAEALAAGDVDAAIAAAIDVIVQPFRTVGAAISYFSDRPGFLTYPLVAAATLLYSGVVATGEALWDIVEAAFEFDVVGVVNAVLNVPAIIADGVLNGRYSETIGGYLPGLLTVGDWVLSAPGLASFLITVDQDIAESIPVRSSTVNALATVDTAVSSTQAPTTDERGIASSATAEKIEQVSEEPANSDDMSVTASDPSELDQESSGAFEGEEDASEPETPEGADDTEIVTDPSGLDQESAGVLDGEDGTSEPETSEDVHDAETNTESTSGDGAETPSDTASVDRGTAEG